MGNQVSPKNVVGRDKLIASLWKRLERESIQFTAERRIGKTTVMNKMKAEPRAGFEVVFLDLEGVDSAGGFVEKLLTEIKPLISKKWHVLQAFEDFKTTLGVTEIGGVIKFKEGHGTNWQTTLDKVVDELCTRHGESVCVLLFDELPYMLQKIDEKNGSRGQEHEALTLLDTLRALRGRYADNLRMIFAGSLGLHHVITDLRKGRIASEPVNDMPVEEIHALAHEDALDLAARLLREEAVSYEDSDSSSLLNALVKETDCIPFYMRKVVSRLAELGRDLKLEDVHETVMSQLTSDNDPWEMEHFRRRLGSYYRGSIRDAENREIQRSEIARVLIDHFSMVDNPQTIEEAWRTVRAQLRLGDRDRDQIVQMLKMLGQDHYLACDRTKRYSFRFPLVKRWWRIAQGI